MRAAECDHGSPVGACPVCERAGRPPVREQVERATVWSWPFAATYPGDCASCGFRFEPGDLVRRRSVYRGGDPYGEYVHADCPVEFNGGGL